MGPRTTDGLLLVDKPAGMTSHDVVSVARRAVGPSRVGHAGTLDPFATGLLVLLVGRGTRLIPYLDAEPKVYDATIRFGAATDTDDSTGRVMRESALPAPAAVDAALATMVGDLEQRPPAYSAKQVEGVRAYAAARRGRPLDLAPVTVRVHAWTVRERRDAELDVTVICGGGTYVRALARDLGEAVGSAAHLTALRRTRAGRFDVADAQTIDAVQRGEAPLRPLLDAVAHFPAQPLDAEEGRLVAHGRPVPARIPGEWAALTVDGALLAVAERHGDAWQPKVVIGDD
ncbi:MAG TPA: tRNA pseudouridine(55) synthase TruB [Gemmatimonadaceae bacterium]|nr:tRNA pseudouridine(55) synthase TruB [Gemmatimonadaceae bacterium]